MLSNRLSTVLAKSQGINSILSFSDLIESLLYNILSCPPVGPDNN